METSPRPLPAASPGILPVRISVQIPPFSEDAVTGLRPILLWHVLMFMNYICDNSFPVGSRSSMRGEVRTVTWEFVGGHSLAFIGRFLKHVTRKALPETEEQGMLRPRVMEPLEHQVLQCRLLGGRPASELDSGWRRRESCAVVRGLNGPGVRGVETPSAGKCIFLSGASSREGHVSTSICTASPVPGSWAGGALAHSVLH